MKYGLAVNGGSVVKVAVAENSDSTDSGTAVMLETASFMDERPLGIAVMDEKTGRRAEASAVDAAGSSVNVLPTISKAALTY